MSATTSVRVAPGDPGQVDAAAIYHQTLADQLETHAGSITGAAGALQGVWQGEAAASYQTLSTLVTDHFRTAAGHSRSAAQALRRYGRELQRCQREGMQALHQAERWHTEMTTWQTKLTTAQTAVTTAQTALTTAQGQQRAAAAMGAKGAGLAATAGAAVAAAGTALTTAQGDVRTAQRRLDEAKAQLVRWERRGADLWGEAEQAAIQATGSIAPLEIPAPPLAHAIPAGGAPATEDWLPHSAWDWTTLGIGALSGGSASWATETIAGLRLSRRALLAEASRQEALSRDPSLSAAERGAAAREVTSLEGQAGRLAGRITNLGDHLRNLAANGVLGFGVGGVLDAGVHLLNGDQPGKAVGAGAAATAGGYLGAAGAGTLCAGVGAEPLVPVCGAVGGAVGGWVGDKLGGLLGGIADDL